ncbi:phage tail assembly chaperone [Chthonobacter rhizosphaerae]|nr:phage tail assembly chaperone [Chthonobacter rhizosphaerae]
MRLAPDAFWAMTPRELAAAAGARRPGAGAPSRRALEAMMRAHPDG